MSGRKIKAFRLKMFIISIICLLIIIVIVFRKQKQKMPAAIKDKVVTKASSLQPPANFPQAKDLPKEEYKTEKIIKEPVARKTPKLSEENLPEEAQKNLPLQGALPGEKGIKTGGSGQSRENVNSKIRPNSKEIERLKEKNLIIF